jgi:hypothetical protein
MTKLKRLKRGRPPLDDTYQIAIADFLRTHAGLSQRRAFDFSIVIFESRRVPPRRKPRATHPAQWVVEEYELIPRPGAAATFRGREATLRQKAKRMPAAERRRNANAVLTLLRIVT